MAFYLCFSITFSIVFLSSVFRDGSVEYKLNHIITFVLMIIQLFIWYYLYKLIVKVFKQVSDKAKKRLVIATFAFIAAILIALLLVLDVPLAWDYQVIYTHAQEKALTGHMSNIYPEYLQYFPNNICLYLIEVILFRITKMFGSTNFILAAEIFNGLLIYLSIVFTYLFCKRKMSDEKAYFSLVVTCSFAPLFLYLPVFYSDTFSIVCVPLLLYISSFIDMKKKRKKAERKKQIINNILLMILVSLVAFGGLKIKMTIIFVVIGIFADFFIKYGIKKTCEFASIFIVIYFVFSGILNHLTYNHYYVNDYGKIPISHWIMMGLEDPDVDNSERNAYGGYSKRDYDITLSYPTGEKSKARHIKEIRMRLKKYSFLELCDYYDKKIVNTWGDGSYLSLIKLRKNNSNRGPIKKVIIGDDKYKTLIYFEQGVQLAMLLILVFSGIYSFKNKDKENIALHVAVLGVFCFLLIWETRSRYLYNYIPIFVMIVVSYIDKLKIAK